MRRGSARCEVAVCSRSSVAQVSAVWSSCVGCVSYTLIHSIRASASLHILVNLSAAGQYPSQMAYQGSATTVFLDLRLLAASYTALNPTVLVRRDYGLTRDYFQVTASSGPGLVSVPSAISSVTCPAGFYSGSDGGSDGIVICTPCEAVRCVGACSRAAL